MNVAPEWVSAAASLVVAGAAAIAAWQGVKGLNAWRTEALGRRRMELAEDALSDFYEARNAFHFIRSPYSPVGESKDRPITKDEQPQHKDRIDTYWAHLKRLDEKGELFSRVFAKQYRIMAAFGPESQTLYNELKDIRFEVTLAAQRLIRAVKYPRDDEKALDRFEKDEEIIWEGSADSDPIEKRLETLMEKVERYFRAHSDR